MSGKALLVAGGTGGHIYPAVALARELSGRLGPGGVVFAVDKRPLASKVISRLGYRIYTVTSAPLPRRAVWHICFFTVRMLKGLIESLFLLYRVRPEVVVAFGAYTSVPVVAASYIMRIPVILHEQNGFPGMANRFLSGFASRIALSFDSTLKYFPDYKTVVTGNPVREELFKAERKEALRHFGLSPGKITVLVFGGSLGSLEINMNMIGVLPYMEDYRERVQFIHVCGRKSYGKVSSGYSGAGFRARVFGYLDRMDLGYAAADIVVARAGATTISELAALGKPSILVPFPGATSHHQLLNAKPLSAAGGAVCFPEGFFSGEALAVRLIPLINDREKLKRMKEKLEPMGERFRSAASRLSDLVMEYIPSGG